MEAIDPVYSTGVLLLIAAASVALLLFLIIGLKLHAFVSLVLVSVVTAIAAGFPLGDVPDALMYGFADTIGSVALLVGFGVMIGRLLEVTGGAQVLADTLINRFGEKRAPFALGVAALLFGFPIFFDAGLVVMLPFFDRSVRVDQRVVTLTIPPQEVITRDNVPARVAAVCYFRVVDPAAAAACCASCLLRPTPSARCDSTSTAAVKLRSCGGPSSPTSIHVTAVPDLDANSCRRLRASTRLSNACAIRSSKAANTASPAVA